MLPVSCKQRRKPVLYHRSRSQSNATRQSKQLWYKQESRKPLLLLKIVSSAALPELYPFGSIHPLVLSRHLCPRWSIFIAAAGLWEALKHMIRYVVLSPTMRSAWSSRWDIVWLPSIPFRQPQKIAMLPPDGLQSTHPRSGPTRLVSLWEVRVPFRYRFLGKEEEKGAARCR